MYIGFKHKGDFKHIESFFKRARKQNLKEKLKSYAEVGVIALAANTPMRTGKTASSWGYEIVDTGSAINIYWTNSNENKGVNIAILIQYGHGTGGGGYVQGIDYINPTMRPVFETIAENVWKEVNG